MPERTKTKFVNFTPLEDKEAKELVGKLRKRIVEAEQDRNLDVSRAEEAIRLWKNHLWDEEDVKLFEEKFNVSPYQIPAARAPLNQLVSQQRAARYDFRVTPLDPSSYERQRRNRELFVEQHAQEFDNIEQAREHFDRYYDDEFAQAISLYYDKVRQQNKSKYIESEAFENMLITGLDFLKTTYSKLNNPDGALVTDRRSVRQMFWDHSSVDPLLDDIEYIGEINRLYRQDLIKLFPEQVEEIEELYGNYSNFFRGIGRAGLNTSWRKFYDFDTERHDVRLKIAEMWFRDTETRFQLLDLETNNTRLIKHGLDEQQIIELLAEVELDKLVAEVEKGERDPQFFARSEEEVREAVARVVEEKYDLVQTEVGVWYKAVFSHDALFEFKRSPLSHGGHPYTPLYAQFTEGWYTGIVDDIKDLLLAYNKAVMFREVMLANSAKGALFIDKNTVSKSGYHIDDIKEMWTQVGAVIDLDLRGNRRLSDVFQQVTNIGDGLAEIRSVIAELENNIYKIIGVNQAMLGTMGSEAPASAIRQQIQRGQGNNGLIYDNFNRGLETHVHEKVVPMLVSDLIQKKPSAVRGLADNREKWIELNYNEEFDLFVDAIMNGEYQTKLVTKEPDKQTSRQNAAMLLELAQSRPDAINLEAALEFSELPNMHDFLRRNRELMRKTQRDQNMRMIDLQQVQQIMLSQGLDAATAEKLVQQMQKERAKQLEQQQGQGNQLAQGMNTIQKLAGEVQREGAIEQNTLN